MTHDERKTFLLTVVGKIVTGAELTMDEINSFDAFAAVEALGCEKGSEGYDMTALSLALAFNKIKGKALSSSQDSHFGCDMADMRRLLELEGFVHIHTHNFDHEYDGAVVTESDEFYWHEKDGVLFLLESYGVTGMNTCTMYFQIDLHTSKFVGGSGGYEEMEGYDEWIWVGYKDGREGFRASLNELRNSGKLLSQWGTMKDGGTPWLWLCNYVDTKGDEYDHNAITASRVAQFPEHVRKAMNYA